MSSFGESHRQLVQDTNQGTVIPLPREDAASKAKITGQNVPLDNSDQTLTALVGLADTAMKPIVAESKRKKEAQAKKEKDRQEAERKKKAAAAAERQAQLREQLAEEEQRLTAVQSGLLDQWIEVIRQRVIRNWRRPPGAKAGLECEVRVSQIPGGEVVSVQMGKCNGDAAIIRSIENAVYRSSPLPPPADPSLFERTLIFTFKPEQ
jgi:colicin import membrane protein